MRILAVAASILLLAHAPARADSLFDDLGERDGLVRIVDAATVVWLADPRIRTTFEDTNIDRFKHLLVEQLCQISGGNCAYAGRSMLAAHKGLHLRMHEFNALAEDLTEAMERLKLPFTVQNRLIALLAPMYRDVVSR